MKNGRQMVRTLAVLSLVYAFIAAACGGDAGPTASATPPQPPRSATSAATASASSPDATATTAASPSATAAATVTASPTSSPPATAAPTPTSATPQTPAPPTVAPTATPETTRPALPKTATVNVAENFFSPRTVTIAAGGTVTWNWTGTEIHNVTGTFGASETKKGITFSATFPAAGTYEYSCTIHEATGMRGTVIVQ